jgi:hypothetical protein
MGRSSKPSAQKRIANSWRRSDQRITGLLMMGTIKTRPILYRLNPDMVPDINISTLNNGSSNNSTENTSRKNRAPLSLESGVIISLRKEKPKKLDQLEFSDEELAFVDLYHRICLPSGLGFLPVNERSEELDKVLEMFATDFDAEEWIENFREAVEYRREAFRTNPCKYNTLVQVCWKLHY